MEGTLSEVSHVNSTQECCKEEEEQLLEEFLVSITSLSEQFLEVPASLPAVNEVATPPPQLPATQTLEEQFLSRTIILHTSEPGNR